LWFLQRGQNSRQPRRRFGMAQARIVIGASGMGHEQGRHGAGLVYIRQQ
jgi:hypothetical protein